MVALMIVNANLSPGNAMSAPGIVAQMRICNWTNSPSYWRLSKYRRRRERCEDAISVAR
jgi:hypothetical protein